MSLLFLLHCIDVGYSVALVNMQCCTNDTYTIDWLSPVPPLFYIVLMATPLSSHRFRSFKNGGSKLNPALKFSGNNLISGKCKCVSYNFLQIVDIAKRIQNGETCNKVRKK